MTYTPGNMLQKTHNLRFDSAHLKCHDANGTGYGIHMWYLLVSRRGLWSYSCMFDSYLFLSQEKLVRKNIQNAATNHERKQQSLRSGQQE